MKKYIALVFLLAGLCGCSPAHHSAGPPEKILSLSAASTKILYDLGVPPAAIDEYGKIAAGKPEPAVIGKGSSISREKMLELGIDCVILWHYQKDAARMFKKNGLQVVELETFRLKDYPDLIRRLGALTGKEEKAEQLCYEYSQKVSSLPMPEHRKNVYFELYGPMKSAGQESYIGDLLSCSGGVVMNRKTGLISAESLLSHQPELIFYVEGHGSAEELKKRPGFSKFPAVRNDRIHAVPRRLITEGVAPLEAMKFFQKHISEE